MPCFPDYHGVSFMPFDPTSRPYGSTHTKACNPWLREAYAVGCREHLARDQAPRRGETRIKRASGSACRSGR
jgi:hypothetical protein